MNWLDIVIAIPLAWGAYKGYSKGLIMELASMIALILALILGFKLMEYGITLLKPIIGENNKIVPLISFLAIFLIVLIMVNLLGKWLKKIINYSVLGIVDDLGGALIGMLKWGLALSVIIWLLNEANVDIPKQYSRDSLLYPYLLAYGPKLLESVSYIMPFTRDLIDSIGELIS